MAEFTPNALAIIDLETSVQQRHVYDLPHLEDAVMVGDGQNILRVGSNGERESVFQSDGLCAFAQKDGNVWASETEKGVIYQFAKSGKWLAEPIVLAEGLKGPEGVCIGNDGNLLVMENNEDEQDGHNGRLLKVDVNVTVHSPLQILTENR